MGMKKSGESEKQNNASSKSPRGSAPAAAKVDDEHAGNVAEGAHYGKTRRQSQTDPEYK